eukprot:287274_1
MLFILICLLCVVIPIKCVIYSILRDNNGHAVKAKHLNDAQNILNNINVIKFPDIKSAIQLKQIAMYLHHGWKLGIASSTLCGKIDGDLLNQIHSNRYLSDVKDFFLLDDAVEFVDTGIYYLIHQVKDQEFQTRRLAFSAYPISASDKLNFALDYYILSEFEASAVRLDFNTYFDNQEFFVYYVDPTYRADADGNDYIANCNGAMIIQERGKYYIRGILKQNKRKNFQREIDVEYLLFLQAEMERYEFKTKKTIPIQVLQYPNQEFDPGILILLIRPIDPSKKILYITNEPIATIADPVEQYFALLNPDVGLRSQKDSAIYTILSPNSDLVYNTIDIKTVDSISNIDSTLEDYKGLIVFNDPHIYAKYEYILYRNYDRFWNSAESHMYSQFIPMINKLLIDKNHKDSTYTYNMYVTRRFEHRGDVTWTKQAESHGDTIECINGYSDGYGGVYAEKVVINSNRLITYREDTHGHLLYVYRVHHRCVDIMNELRTILADTEITIMAIELDAYRYWNVIVEDDENEMRIAADYAIDKEIPLFFADNDEAWYYQWPWFNFNSISGFSVHIEIRNHVILNVINHIAKFWTKKSHVQKIFIVVGSSHYDNMVGTKFSQVNAEGWVPMIGDQAYQDTLKHLLESHVRLKPPFKREEKELKIYNYDTGKKIDYLQINYKKVNEPQISRAKKMYYNVDYARDYYDDANYDYEKQFSNRNILSLDGIATITLIIISIILLVYLAWIAVFCIIGACFVVNKENVIRKHNQIYSYQHPSKSGSHCFDNQL